MGKPMEISCSLYHPNCSKCIWVFRKWFGRTNGECGRRDVGSDGLPHTCIYIYICAAYLYGKPSETLNCVVSWGNPVGHRTNVYANPGSVAIHLYVPFQGKHWVDHGQSSKETLGFSRNMEDHYIILYPVVRIKNQKSPVDKHQFSMAMAC